ncbi:group 1 glycosyl transferase [[Clostridium] cellulosi]|jgi:Glycosyl transferases group 1.|uniref:Group 1 glycosyl transferase n=1 Tax=[Clostridium] cellulosi TaxID=29343 RepID=A0A078KMX8_9FIRM|nr:group 1 glycosyl transferase [[Clostridium] cellulosi]
MRLLIIPSWYVTEDKPNNGIFFKEQAESLAESGVDVVVAYPDLRFKLGMLRRGIYRDYDAEVPTYIYRKRTLTPFKERGRWPQLTKMLEALYDRVCRDIGEPDIVHLHSCRMGIAAINLCRNHNLPLVYTEHYSGILGQMDDDLKYQFEKTLEACDCAIAVSEDLKARMVSKKPDTLFIPNMVDTSSFKIIPNVEPTGEFVFGAVGNLVPVKGYDILIRAFAKAYRHMPGAKLYIAGTGEQEQALKDLITELKLQDSVHLTGFLTRAMAPKFYNGCDCFVCSSYTETFGISLIEALSCGKPVIATRCGGPESIVNSKNGLLINPGDELSMERALIYMYRRAKSYNPFVLREDCMKRFGKSYICQRLVQLYAHILENRRRFSAQTEE